MDSIKIKEKLNLPLIAGTALILIGAVLVYLSFHSIISSEVKYIVNKPNVSNIEVMINDVDETKAKNNIVFLSPKFGLAIPKIDANANVLEGVDPYNPSIYNQALAKGVAHAKGSVLPGEKGNIFLFAHSAVNFYDFSKYNINFYLLNKLKKGDSVYVSYNTKIYKYEVEKVNIVNKNEVKYLSNYEKYNTLTLMTCWPAGLNISRLIVTAKEVNN